MIMNLRNVETCNIVQFIITAVALLLGFVVTQHVCIFTIRAHTAPAAGPESHASSPAPSLLCGYVCTARR